MTLLSFSERIQVWNRPCAPRAVQHLQDKFQSRVFGGHGVGPTPHVPPPPHIPPPAHVPPPLPYQGLGGLRDPYRSTNHHQPPLPPIPSSPTTDGGYFAPGPQDLCPQPTSPTPPLPPSLSPRPGPCDPMVDDLPPEINCPACILQVT